MAVSRRDFLARAAAAGAGFAIVGAGQGRGADPPRRPKVAAIFTSFTHRSHAHVILENFLQPYLFNGRRTDPGVDVVSFYADQSPAGDMAPDVARQFKIPLYKTIDEALCLGGRELAVDAVLSIGEHGSYPRNKLGQVEYPRERFFDEAVEVMERSKRFVPLFNDKHLSYRWKGAKRMYDTARRLGISLMAGSSVPLAQRIPNIDIGVLGARIIEAVSIHGGGLESYDFHGLEVLQSLVEARAGGETGVVRVEFLSGEPLWKAADEGRWSIKLADAALAAEVGHKASVREFDKKNGGKAHGILLTHKDGLRATVLKLGESAVRWNFACRIDGEKEPRATRWHVGPWNNRNLFKALSHAIQHHFIHRESPFPVERTLLTTGILDAAMHSRHENRPLDTPHLTFAYKPRDFRAFRETGATWKIITDQTPEPKGIAPHGLR